MEGPIQHFLAKGKSSDVRQHFLFGGMPRHDNGNGTDNIHARETRTSLFYVDVVQDDLFRSLEQRSRCPPSPSHRQFVRRGGLKKWRHARFDGVLCDDDDGEV